MYVGLEHAPTHSQTCLLTNNTSGSWTVCPPVRSIPQPFLRHVRRHRSYAPRCQHRDGGGQPKHSGRRWRWRAGAAAALQLVARILVAGRRLLADATLYAGALELLAADLLARRTDDGAAVQPAAGHDADVQLLAGVEALVRVVGNL